MNFTNFFRINFLTSILIIFFLGIPSICVSTNTERNRTWERTKQAWLQGYDYYLKGDYEMALSFFQKSRIISGDSLYDSKFHSVDAINHCLYLLGREDEIDTRHSWNGGKFYQEIDTLEYINTAFWGGEDTIDRFMEKNLLYYYSKLKADSINGVQDTWIHYKRLDTAGGLCLSNGLFEEAISFLRPALDLERRLTPPRFRYNLYRSAKNVVETYLRLGLADSALFVARQHLQECPNQYSNPQALEGYVNAENLLIDVYMRLQLYDEAWREIEFADSIICANDTNSHHLYETSWKIEYFNAIGRIDKALEMTRKYQMSDLKWNPITINTGIKLVYNLQMINDIQSAIPIQRSIVEYCDTTLGGHILYSQQFTRMACLYMSNHEYENASYWFNKADSILTQNILFQKSLYIDNKSWQAAMAIVTNSDSLYKERMMELEELVTANNTDTSDNPDICMLKGVYEANKGNYDVAKEHFLKYLDFQGIDQYNTIYNLSKCYLFLNKLDSAYHYANILVKNRRDPIIHNFESLSSREREFFWDRASEPFNILCNSIVKSGRADLMGQLYNDVALFSKGLLLTASSSPDYIERLKINWHDVQKCLRKSEAAVEFIATPHEDADSSFYVALVLRYNSEQPVMIKLGKGEEIKSAIKDGYTTSALSEIIWFPLKDELKDIKTVWFSVDGILHKIPIEYLPYNKKKNISNIYQLNRLTSTRELVIHNSKLSKENAVLFGDLTYTPSSCENSSNNDSDEDLVRAASKRLLPFTKDEIRTVSTILKDKGVPCKIYDQDQGTRSSLLALNGLPISYLHLATHGYYYETDTIKKELSSIPSLMGFSMSNLSQAEKAMLRSGLVMSDSIVTAYDVSHLSFNNLRLVALSACGSGLGDIGRGEGVFGLQRAFKQAGAQSILMTLWDVNDYMTYRFMEHFYSKISSGYSMQKALKSAQKKVRNTKVNGVYDFRDPKYWAGYILLDAFN